MHGVYVNGYRPKTKKVLKEAIAELNARATHPAKNSPDNQCAEPGCENPIFTKEELATGVQTTIAPDFCVEHETDEAGNIRQPIKMPLVRLQATSIYGNEFDGTLEEAVADNQYGVFYLVGPDPYTNRRWYANLRYNAETGRWTVQ